MRTIRRADVGLAGNGGRFATATRGDVAVEIAPAPIRAPGRELTLDPEVANLATDAETSFDADGRTVVVIGIDRDQLPTSDYRVGCAPWEITDVKVSDEQVDIYLESRSDDPEAFAEEIGFTGQARWDSPASALELTHTGFEGISDEDMSAAVSETLRNFSDDLAVRGWQ